MRGVSAYEAVIGLEVHVQLSTESKLFCCSRTRPENNRSVGEEDSNTAVCEVCAGHPGTLPVVNKKAVEYGIRLGLATQSAIRPLNVFARKHYFYPDLPKGYQVSQFDLPICENGSLTLTLEGGVQKTVRIQRIHMEEDAGKNQHFSGYSLINLNRAGVPLLEVVSAPELKSPEEAGAYLRELYSIVTYLGICDGNLQEGNFRCDANVSVMPVGSTTLGTRTEIKNVNSFKFIEKAIEYEIRRQTEVIRSGGRVIQETRGFDSAKGTTFTMRSKEDAHDYRYFPDPDLPPIRIPASWIEAQKELLPELPAQKKERYQRLWGLNAQDIEVITSTQAWAQYFEAALHFIGTVTPTQAKTAANLLLGEVARLVNEKGGSIHSAPFSPRHLADLTRLISDQVVSSTGAKSVVSYIWDLGGTQSVEEVVEKQGLKQVSDLSALEPVIDEVLAKNPSQVAEYKSGKEKLIGFFVGQVMKATGGKANPQLLQEMVKRKLS